MEKSNLRIITVNIFDLTFDNKPGVSVPVRGSAARLFATVEPITAETRQTA